MRQNFTAATKLKIAQKANLICSNGECLRFTGYGTDDGDARTVADAGHIAPASIKGPRGKSAASDCRDSSANGIWLCKICHKMVDDDPGRYTDLVLREWKEAHEKVLRRIVGKDLAAVVHELRHSQIYHQECRDLLAFMDSKRVFYELFDYESPQRVIQSLDIVRNKLTEMRSRLAVDSDLFKALGLMQEAIRAFLRDIGHETDLDSLRCNFGDPVFERFVTELALLRRQVSLTLRPIAESVDYPLSWLA